MTTVGPEPAQTGDSPEDPRRPPAQGETLAKVLRHIEQLEQLVSASQVASSDVLRRMDQLRVDGAALSGFLRTIRGVTQQTRVVLANARLDAHRAGEGGQPLAAVANEVHALAYRIEAAVEQIEAGLEALDRALQAEVAQQQREEEQEQRRLQAWRTFMENLLRVRATPAPSDDLSGRAGG